MNWVVGYLLVCDRVSHVVVKCGEGGNVWLTGLNATI